jgi:nitric oxide reductase NorE protein
VSRIEIDTNAAAPARKVPGEEGIWVFVIGDMAVFALFFGVFMYTRGHDPTAFSPGSPGLDRPLGALNTVLLLTGSLLVVLGTQFRPRSSRLLLAAAGCGAGFVAIKAVEWSHLFAAGRTPQTNEFYSYYFIFTGIHLLHVLIGIAVLVRLAVLTSAPAPSKRTVSVVQSGGIFWHMVDLLWIVLFTLFYLLHNGAS